VFYAKLVLAGDDNCRVVVCCFAVVGCLIVHLGAAVVVSDGYGFAFYMQVDVVVVVPVGAQYAVRCVYRVVEAGEG